MMAHYRREGDVPELRANIDASRTRNNYSIRMYARGGRNEAGIVPGRGMATAETVAARVAAVEEKSGRKVRKDAVVLADLVVTLPRDVRDGDDKRFFKECVEYMAGLVGMDNIVGAYVHMDEKTPHVHIAWTPVVTKPNGKPSFSYKSMMTRGKYRALHKELAKRVEGKLGYPVEIELSEDRQKEKVLSSVPQDKLDAARAAIEAEYVQPALDKRDEIEAECARAAERLESLQEEARLVEEEIEGLDLRGEEIKARIGRIEEERRGVEEEADREGRAARERAEKLERKLEEVEGRGAECREAIERNKELERRARKRTAFLEKWISRFKRAIKAVGERIEEVRDGIASRKEEIQRERDRASFPQRLERARRAAAMAGMPLAVPLPDDPETAIWIDGEGQVYERYGEWNGSRGTSAAADMAQARSAASRIAQSRQAPQRGRGRGL